MRKKLMLYNTHSIPEGKEPIPLLYRFLVGVQHMLATRKRGHQHDQSALRQMEIGDQAVHGLEGVARIDENVRPSGLGLESAVVPTQMTRPPFRFVSFSMFAVSAFIMHSSECI